MSSIPNDPVMLLSFVNTQLRDNYSSIEEFAKNYDAPLDCIIKKLSAIDYTYDRELNQFI